MIIPLIILNYFNYSLRHDQNDYSQLFLSFRFGIIRTIGNNHASLFPIMLIIPEKKIKIIKMIKLI